MILVTGASGKLGSAVAEHLLVRGAKPEFAVFARSPSKVKQLIEHGVEARFGDFDDPAGLAHAFEGVSRLLLVSSRSLDRAQQQIQVVDAALAAGVQHIVYTGLAIQDIAQSQVRGLMQSHFDTEEHIRGSGVAYTFLRNTMYADALPEIVGGGWPEHGVVLPGGSGKVPYALRREMGEATANLLLEQGHAMKTYQLTGGVAYSYQAVADVLGELAGHPVPYVDADPIAFTAQLKALGLPEFLIDLTVGTVLDVRAQQYNVPSHDLRLLLGREPMGLTGMLREVFGLPT